MSVLKAKSVELEKGSKYNVNLEAFRSTLELVETCKTRKITDRLFDDEEKKDHDKSWAGVSSYKEALDLMNDGWNEKVKELKGVIDGCKQRQADKRVGFRNDVLGFAPIVPLAIMGIPTAMLNTTVKAVKTKVVDIYYNMGVSCGVSSDKIFENGRKVVELIVKLENCGYRVSLNIVQAYTDSSSADILAVNVKSANQLLDLKRICFPTMHTAFFRVIGFDWYTKTPNGKYRGGYGRPLHGSIGTSGAKELFKKLIGEEAIYIDAKELMDKDGADKLLTAIKGGNNGKVEI